MTAEDDLARLERVAVWEIVDELSQSGRLVITDDEYEGPDNPIDIIVDEVLDSIRYQRGLDELFEQIEQGRHDAPAWTIELGTDIDYALGVHFGYPRCCIDAFCRADPHDRRNEAHRASGLRHVPCSACADKIPRETPPTSPAATSPDLRK